MSLTLGTGVRFIRKPTGEKRLEGKKGPNIPVGHMLDVSIGWDPQWSFLKRVSFDIGFSHIFKGDYFDKVPNSPGSKDTNYGYTMATIKF